MNQTTAYKVLGLENHASIDEIKAAYAELSKKYHPEESPEEFQQIHEAYETLTRQTRNRNRIMSHVSITPNIDIERYIQENLVEEENEESSFDFSNVDIAKQEDYERRLQSAMKQLDGVMYIDKNLNTILLKRILTSSEREIIYSEEFIEKLIGLLQEALVNKDAVKIIKKYLRPWDRELNDKREVLNRLKRVLEKRNEYYTHYIGLHMKAVTDSISSLFLFVFLGIMLLVCLVTNLGAVIKSVFILFVISGMMNLVFKVCRKFGTEWFSYMISFLSGSLGFLLVYLSGIWKWILDSEFVEGLNIVLVHLFGVLTITAFIEWKKGK